MASIKSPELSATEIELKRRGRRRLIGAATIGLLGIVFLPMIFDGEPKRNSTGSTLKKQEISVQVPAREGQPALPTPSAAPSPAAAISPVPPAQIAVETSKATPGEAAKPAPEVPVKVEKSEPAREGQPVLPTPSAKPAPAAVNPAVPPAQIAVETSKATPGEAAKPAPEIPAKVEKSEPAIKPTVPVADSAKTGFAVQLGVFADAENAKITIEKMKDAKLPVYSDSIPIKSGSATRVRIGPFPTREKADSALVQIKLAGGDGKIVPLQ